jgi:hypothetical protein
LRSTHFQPHRHFFACHCPLARARVERTAASKIGSKVQFGGQSRMNVLCWWIRGTFPKYVSPYSWSKLAPLISKTGGSHSFHIRKWTPRQKCKRWWLDWMTSNLEELQALGGTTPRGCSFTIDCHQVSLSKWVSAIMRWTKVNTMPQTIPNRGLLWGLPWFT